MLDFHQEDLMIPEIISSPSQIFQHIDPGLQGVED
jgi:hypothetical protein